MPLFSVQLARSSQLQMFEIDEGDAGVGRISAATEVGMRPSHPEPEPEDWPHWWDGELKGTR
jgi:hypothetical protein